MAPVSTRTTTAIGTIITTRLTLPPESGESTGVVISALDVSVREPVGVRELVAVA